MPTSPAVSETGEQMFGATRGRNDKESPTTWAKDSLLAMWGRWLRPANHTDPYDTTTKLSSDSVANPQPLPEG